MAPRSSPQCHACLAAHPDMPLWSLRQHSLHVLLKGMATPASTQPHCQQWEGAGLSAMAEVLPSPPGHQAPLLASVSPHSTAGLMLVTPLRAL